MRYQLFLAFMLCASCAQQGAPPAAPQIEVAKSKQGVAGQATWFSLKVNYVRDGAEAEGSATKKRVVLLHHTAMDSSEWKDVQTGLVAGGYDVVAVDLFGHGGTDCPDMFMDRSALGESATAVMDAIKWDKAHWVGVGLGGEVTATTAFMHPDRMQSMTIMSAGNLTSMLAAGGGPMVTPNIPVAPPDTPNPAMSFPQVCAPHCPSGPPLWPPTSTKSAKLAYLLMLSAKASTVTDSFAQDAFKAELKRSCYSVNERAQRNGVKNFADAILISDLAKVKVPTKILWGEKDQILKPMPWTGAWSTIPGSSAQILTGCGFDLPRDCPTEVTAAVKAFIDAQP